MPDAGRPRLRFGARPSRPANASLAHPKLAVHAAFGFAANHQWRATCRSPSQPAHSAPLDHRRRILGTTIYCTLEVSVRPNRDGSDGAEVLNDRTDRNPLSRAPSSHPPAGRFHGFAEHLGA